MRVVKRLYWILPKNICSAATGMTGPILYHSSSCFWNRNIYIYICKLEINKIYVFYKIIFALFLVPQLHSYKHDQVLYPHQVPQSVLFIKPYMKSWEIFRFLSFFSWGQVNNALNLINEWMNHAWSCTLLQLMSLF